MDTSTRSCRLCSSSSPISPTSGSRSRPAKDTPSGGGTGPTPRGALQPHPDNPRADLHKELGDLGLL